MLKCKRFKALAGVVCFLSLITLSFAKTGTGDRYDPFALLAEDGGKLAEQVAARWDGNGNVKIIKTRLPLDQTPGKGFTPTDKIDTQEELEAELVRMRKRFEPFMADLAPAISETRTRMDLKSFDWRIATQEDLADDSGVFAGQGEWKQVAIPHYGGPVNKVTTYYRKEVNLDKNLLKADTLYIHFNAADYIAEVFVNGKLVGRHEGLFGSFEFDIKPLVKPGKNVILVKLHNDIKMLGDSHMNRPPWKIGHKLAGFGGPGWNEPGRKGGNGYGNNFYAWGWHCCASGMGIWQRCWLEARSAAFVNDIYVRPLPEKNGAEVWLEVADSTKPIEVSYSLYGQNFKATLAKNVKVDVAFGEVKEGIRQCKFMMPIAKQHYRWWTMDTPWLYQVQIQVKQGGKVVDVAKRHFGMRTFTQSLTSTPKGRFYFNGKEIKLRGANMMGNLMQCVIRGDLDQLRDDILLAKITNMNFWRMTQQPCPEIVYDYFDKLGLLAQSDLPAFGGITRAKKKETIVQFEEMMRLVRRHPCNAILSYMNEPAKPGVNKYNRAHMNPKELHSLFRQFDTIKEEMNPGQAAKWLDGDIYHVAWKNYVDHHQYEYWYGPYGYFRKIYHGYWPRSKGWMSAAGEFGSEALDSVALMKKYYPKEWIKTGPNGEWSPSVIPMCQQLICGKAWYYPPKTMEDWVAVSQEHQRVGTRLRTEAMRRIPWLNSFALHLLIDAWPAGWMKSVMDCDRQAKPAFFEYIDALTPLAVNLQPHSPVSYYRQGGQSLTMRAWILNDTHRVPEGATLRYQVELASKILHTGDCPATITPMDPTCLGDIHVKRLPVVKKRQPVTVRLALFDKDGTLLHDTAVDIDLIPKGKRVPAPGGQATKLLRTR